MSSDWLTSELSRRLIITFVESIQQCFISLSLHYSYILRNSFVSLLETSLVDWADHGIRHRRKTLARSLDSSDIYWYTIRLYQPTINQAIEFCLTENDIFHRGLQASLDASEPNWIPAGNNYISNRPAWPVDLAIVVPFPLSPALTSWLNMDHGDDNILGYLPSIQLKPSKASLPFCFFHDTAEGTDTTRYVLDYSELIFFLCLPQLDYYWKNCVVKPVPVVDKA